MADQGTGKKLQVQVRRQNQAKIELSGSVDQWRQHGADPNSPKISKVLRGLLIPMAPWAQPFATTRKARTSEEISALLHRQQLHRHVMWFLMVFDPTAQVRFLFAVRPQIFGGPSDIVG